MTNTSDKLRYEPTELDILLFSTSDIITTSPTGGSLGGDDNGDGGWTGS